MSTSGNQRRQIEDNILSLARKVDTGDSRWLEGEAFSAFIEAWPKLAHYYEGHRDTTLDAHILKLYMRYAVTLRRIIEDEQAAHRRRQQAKSALRTLNSNLDDVFHKIERNGGRAAV